MTVFSVQKHCISSQPASLPLSLRKFRLTNFCKIATFQSSINNPSGGGADISLFSGENLESERDFVKYRQGQW